MRERGPEIFLGLAMIAIILILGVITLLGGHESPGVSEVKEPTDIQIWYDSVNDNLCYILYEYRGIACVRND